MRQIAARPAMRGVLGGLASVGMIERVKQFL